MTSMIITKDSAPFIQDYITSLNEILRSHSQGQELSRLQSMWLQFVILGMLVTNSLCWSKFERFGLQEYGKSALCWMFRKASIFWEYLLQASVIHVLFSYNVKVGTLVIDDSDRERSKNVTQIGMAHKIKDKKTGGYFLGQNIVFLILVAEEITVPVGFRFYEPDPELTAWRKEEARLVKKKVEKKYRPSKPEKNSDYPTKIELAEQLVEEFAANHKSCRVKAVVADAAYSTDDFLTKCREYCPDAQIISEIKNNQLVFFNNRYTKVSDVFANFMGTTEEVTLRANKQQITYRSAKLKLKAHDGKKRYIIALKYDGESEYRYLVANDMTWRDIDVIKAYANRWLVEVFIQDWKSYEGWGQLAKQRGCIGADRGVLLSLLCDHALHFHQAQLNSFKNNEPAITTGSLRETVMLESLVAFIENIVSSSDPKSVFKQCSGQLAELFELKTSLKHLRSFKNMEETVVVIQKT